MYRSKRERKHGASGHASRSAAAEGEELSEVLPDPAELDPPVVVAYETVAYETVSTAWKVDTLYDERIAIWCVMGSEDFEYNTNTGIVYDVRGVERDVSKPDLEIIDKARIEY